MGFPTIEEVENASGYQILKWNRFLPSGENESERLVQNRIFERYGELTKSGEIDSSTSKQVGWGR